MSIHKRSKTSLLPLGPYPWTGVQNPIVFFSGTVYLLEKSDPNQATTFEVALYTDTE